LNRSPIVVTKADIAQESEQFVRQRMLMILGFVLLFVVVGAVFVPRLFGSDAGKEITVSEGGDTAVSPTTSLVKLPGTLSPIFSPTVLYWESEIVTWSAQNGLDPDIAATIMQIESCGDPQALSHAGAQGLFQVMPFHFEAGEDAFNPDTNAFRGLSFYSYVLDLTGGDVGRALAGYNGGPAAALGDWSNWLPETQRYYTWGTGIYEDAKAGLDVSPTLQEWLTAGGASLCRQAADRLGM